MLKDPIAPQDHRRPVAPFATGNLRPSAPPYGQPVWLKGIVAAVMVLASGLAAGLTMRRQNEPIAVHAPPVAVPVPPARPAQFTEPAARPPVLLATSVPGLPPEIADHHPPAPQPKARKSLRRRVKRQTVALPSAGLASADALSATSAGPGTAPAAPDQSPPTVREAIIEEGPFRLGLAYPAGSPAKATDLGLRAGSDVRHHGQRTDGCRVTLGARPEALISIDGTPVGTTPILDLRVPCGRRTIVWKSLTDERRQQVLVQPGPIVRRWMTFQ